MNELDIESGLKIYHGIQQKNIKLGYVANNTF